MALGVSTQSDNPEILRLALAHLRTRTPDFAPQDRFGFDFRTALGRISSESRRGHEIYAHLETLGFDWKTIEHEEIAFRSVKVAKGLLESLLRRNPDIFKPLYLHYAMRNDLLDIAKQLKARSPGSLTPALLCEAFTSGSLEMVAWAFSQADPSLSCQQSQFVEACLKSGKMEMVQFFIELASDFFHAEIKKDFFKYCLVVVATGNLDLFEWIIKIGGQEKLAGFSPDEQDQLFAKAANHLSMIKQLESLNMKPGKNALARVCINVEQSDSLSHYGHFSLQKKKIAIAAFNGIGKIVPMKLQNLTPLWRNDLVILQTHLPFADPANPRYIDSFFTSLVSNLSFSSDLPDRYALLKARGYIPVVNQRALQADYEGVKQTRATLRALSKTFDIDWRFPQNTFMGEQLQRWLKALDDLIGEMEKDLGLASSATASSSSSSASAAAAP